MAVVVFDGKEPRYGIRPRRDGTYTLLADLHLHQDARIEPGVRLLLNGHELHDHGHRILAFGAIDVSQGGRVVTMAREHA